MRLTIGIKALNEERHIEAALRSAVAAAQPFAGEVILADSGSQDRTVSIARQFPVRIIQLANRNERRCGAGAQLAFQEAAGEYFCLMDGDMVIDPAFVAAGITFLDEHPEVAGVGGHVREINVENEEFRIRAAEMRKEAHRRVGEVDRLDQGGIYRSAAIRDAGYFADRNLHAFEEFELGARLRARGWKLARIDHAWVDHHGHTTEGYRLLWRRIRSGHAGATGEVLRAAMGRRHFTRVLRDLGHIRNGMAVIAWWLALIVAMILRQPIAVAALVALPLAWFWYRRGSLRLGIYSFVSWNSIALGLVTGLFGDRRPPRRRIAAVDLTESPPRML